MQQKKTLDIDMDRVATLHPTKLMGGTGGGPDWDGPMIKRPSHS